MLERNASMRQTVLLLDSYSEEAALLHGSLKAAGFCGITLTVEDDGFLPEGVTSIYQYFCGPYSAGERIPGRPRYFNQISVPDYWEISGSNVGGSVFDMGKERGKIFYAQPLHKRLVRVVDWMDEKGTVRSSDHYNRQGALYARTYFNHEGKRFCRIWYNGEGQEAVYENFATHDILVNYKKRTYLLKNRTELARMVLEDMGATEWPIFYNSLSTPFFLSEQLPAGRREDILFWQEDPREDIPGNMLGILNGSARRTQKIYVQKRKSYENLTRLGASTTVMAPLGYVFNFKRENRGTKNVLICTNSDQLESCEELIQAFPEMHFHISAITEMSSKLMCLGKYSNVSLYPGIKATLQEELFNSCDYYLDINHGTEIFHAVKTAFLHNMLIAGFSKTLHNRNYIAPEHVFEDAHSLESFLREVSERPRSMQAAIDAQKKQAMAENSVEYQKIIG